MVVDHRDRNLGDADGGDVPDRRSQFLAAGGRDALGVADVVRERGRRSVDRRGEHRAQDWSLAGLVDAESHGYRQVGSEEIPCGPRHRSSRPLGRSASSSASSRSVFSVSALAFSCSYSLQNARSM
jgi:hypothetical protein